MTKIIKEPLLHFLFLGAILFLYFEKCAPEFSSDDQTILVNKNALLTLMQYQSKAFNTEHFESKFDNLNEQERQQLINDYVREETLFREAKRLSLNANDYVIKRRMIQKIDFIYQNQIAKNLVLSEDSLLQFFEKNKENYRKPTFYTFSHIFYKKEKEDFSNALEKANQLLKTTKSQKIDFTNSLQFGERFLYHRHYVERDLAFIEGHFGKEFLESIRNLDVNNEKWKGPFKSEHGYHLVLLSDKKETVLPDFESLKSVLKEDYKRKFEKELKENLIDELIKEYEVIIDLNE